MRRERDTPNGLTEFLVVRAIEALRERGVEEVSLNFAAFGARHARPSRAARANRRRAIALGNPFFQIESLYRFNAKFFPRCSLGTWSTRGPSACREPPLAVMWAEGQLPKPKPRRRAAVGSAS